MEAGRDLKTNEEVKEEMNQSLDRLQYLSRAAPLEKQLSFMELQQRPLGFQTAIPREPIGEAMNSLEFKSMEGAMYENAAYAGQQMRSEQLKDVMVSEASARHGLPHDVIQELVRQQGGLPQELQGSGAQAQAFFCRRGHARFAGTAARTHAPAAGH